ncbi:hemin uptake protein HemP [Hydrogenophaga pseudoflava]|uniref:hemin uptake protein HemP n=1 Tax=Hydrogenophaga pseudoflava TaxID=47421 RepID=UPI0027E5B5B4|nr:hemin uptake protein HemP [Hydrogenophaga pseudoflava]MDQ7744048.1 hemin uptake protein HemP [Hydrogenophaga pseudoflava]
MNRPTTAAPATTSPVAAPAQAPAAGAAPVLSSQSVLQGRSQVAIEHNGAVYRLQTTRQGKLILTK